MTAQEMLISIESNSYVDLEPISLKIDDVQTSVDALENYDESNVVNLIGSLGVVLSNIQNDTTEIRSELSALDIIMSSVPTLSEIREEMINVQFGGLEIVSNQMIIKDRSGVTVAIFDLFDKNGLPTMSSVYKREVV